MVNKAKYFFVLSLGRAGTMFLADLLNSVPNLTVKHEPNAYDRRILFYSYAKNFENIVNGLMEKRFEDIKVQNGGSYGEVNSYLRYNGDWLQKNLNAQILYMARDGRDFVKSAFPRTVYTHFENQQAIVPKDDDNYSDEWFKMDRFEKLCWYWTKSNEYLYKKYGKPILFEEIVRDYDYFNNNILQPINVEMDKEAWDELRGVRKNKTNKKRMTLYIKNLIRQEKYCPEYIGRYPDWNSEMKSKFNTICGSLMEKLGYEA